MNKATSQLLTSAELQLILETERPRLDALDEDELCDLHARVRRARNKFSKLYRRQASAQVVADSARGNASKKNQRTAAKAEVFEDALARVSARLARVARNSAAELKAERLAAARREPGGTRGPKRAAAKASSPAGRKTKTASSSELRAAASKRASASTRAAGKRRQAKRDSR